MDEVFTQLAISIAILIAVFSAQVYTIKRLVAYLKDALHLSGNATRLMSFAVGLITGALILWVFIDYTPGLKTSEYVFIGAFFLVISGLVASGDYDLNKLPKG